MRRVAGRASLVAALAVVAEVGLVAPAHAVTVACGATITTNTTLSGDVGPCPNNGIIVGADNITLNLNRFQVFGTSGSGDGAGILVSGRTGVTVTNGTVTDFDGGVVVRGGGGNTVRNIAARHNIGASEGHPPALSTLYGDGIAIEASANNVVAGNIAVDNGPYSGIGLFQVSDTDHPGYATAPTTGNQILSNVVTDNVACRRGPFCDNDGIRIEPNVGPGNVISLNSVKRNGLDGISLFGGVSGQTVRRNSVDSNGFLGAVPGDGIRVFGFNNLIESNTSKNNAASGISVARRYPTLSSFPATNPNGRGNTIRTNATGGNLLFDLWDSNPGCDANIWKGNTFQTANQACTTTP